MRELEAQDDQSGDHPIGENQLMIRAAALGPQTLVTSTFTHPGVLPCHLGPGQLSDDLAELVPGDAGADTIRESPTGQGSLHNFPNPYGSSHVTA
ncbi:hypothetical protein [Streptomyces sp. NPDC057909]|uniref:hypothetical protein n=1 Tax=Streptomyces sp. NPDC057909 TaxID=3346277 RepID=UPI0036EF1144